jgi:hypothetical protein
MARLLAHTLCRLCELGFAVSAIWFAFVLGRWIGL